MASRRHKARLSTWVLAAWLVPALGMVSLPRLALAPADAPSRGRAIELAHHGLCSPLARAERPSDRVAPPAGCVPPLFSLVPPRSTAGLVDLPRLVDRPPARPWNRATAARAPPLA